ncbi:competence type IV pilus minor pilin ComGD [Bacillus sp. FSL K6-3431]|uniref:competence type IV pilus minor pilin ComGD n=1 Tax=Bacillus sp. FSL K6-3431 TaxID=2921500 RepID=UPI0030F7C7A6
MKILHLNNAADERGFTLLEVLIVITVLTVMLSFSVFTLGNFAEVMQKQLFITKLQSDLFYAQAYAIHQKEPVVVRFSKVKNGYQAMSKDTQTFLFERKIPAPIYLSESNLVSLTFTAEGTVSNFGTIIFKMGNKSIKLTFYIGRGRFSVQE